MYKCSFLVWKNARFNYREFDLEVDLVGVPHTWYLSGQYFITRLKLVWRELDMVAMNNWKKKCVGLQRTWASKRTVLVNLFTNHHKFWNILVSMLRIVVPSIVKPERRIGVTSSIYSSNCSLTAKNFAQAVKAGDFLKLVTWLSSCRTVGLSVPT